MAAKVLPMTSFIPDTRQREAVEHVEGPMVVIAGAGTGKTTVLIQRIARLIREGHARPDEILALTYTDNAADEMKTRVVQELGPQAKGLQTCTFHAWCNELLQRSGASFQVLDEKDLWVYLRRRIRDLELKHFIRAANLGQFLLDLLDFMRRCHDELVSPEQYAAYVGRLERGEIPLPRVEKAKKQADLEDSEILDRCREIARVFAAVEKMLRAGNLGTFGHMITDAYHLLKSDAALLEKERNKIRFLLVDEFQDANFAQIEILAQLAGQKENLFIVGDPDQAIYQFRGASSEAFSLFAQRFKAAKLVVLGENRRSLSPVLESAFCIVKENPPVFADKGSVISYQRTALKSCRERAAKEEGEPLTAAPVEIVTWGDREVEAADLAYQLRKRHRELRCPWSDFAVLYRQHLHREELVQELLQAGIPFAIEGLDVLDTPEVRDMVACLGAAVAPNDASALFRVAALPQFGIDPAELYSATRGMRRNEINLRAALEKIKNGPAVLQEVAAASDEISKKELPARDAVKTIIRRFALSRTNPLDAFVEFVESWHKKPVAETGSVSEFLEYLDLFRQARGTISLKAPPGDAIRLMTVHAAKGMEFRYVTILRGSSSSGFPSSCREPLVAFPKELRTSQIALQDDKVLHDEEERRLFYVAMTRAKDALTIYVHQGRGKNPSPTKFVRDLMTAPAYSKFWQQRAAAAVQDQLFGAEEMGVARRSTAASWLLMPLANAAASGLSATAIEIYEKCPLRFKLERGWNLPRDVPAALHYGAAMHRALYTFFEAQRMGREITDEQLLENFRADLAGAGIADRYQYEIYLRQGREQLTQFLADARTGVLPKVLETEKKFDVTVAGTRIVGRMDRIDGLDGNGVAIVDYKTGRPKTQEDADDSLQLSLYALAAKQAWGMRVDRLILHNLEDNSEIVTTRSETEMLKVEECVRKVGEGIAEGRFPAKPGFQCGFCPYRYLCPATEKLVQPAAKKAIRKAN